MTWKDPPFIHHFRDPFQGRECVTSPEHIFHVRGLGACSFGITALKTVEEERNCASRCFLPHRLSNSRWSHRERQGKKRTSRFDILNALPCQTRATMVRCPSSPLNAFGDSCKAQVTPQLKSTCKKTGTNRRVREECVARSLANVICPHSSTTGSQRNQQKGVRYSRHEE